MPENTWAQHVQKQHGPEVLCGLLNMKQVYVFDGGRANAIFEFAVSRKRWRARRFKATEKSRGKRRGVVASGGKSPPFARSAKGRPPSSTLGQRDRRNPRKQAE